MRNLWYMVLILPLLIGGCRPQTTPVVSTSTATSPPAPKPTEIRPTVKPTETRLTLKPCTVVNGTIQAECGYFLVPEDRAHPKGRVLNLGMVVVRARDPNPEPDPLFYIAGGPGGAATSAGIVYSVSNLFNEINAKRDVIFLDQRGTNGKHRLICENPSFTIADAPQKRVDDWIEQCLTGLDGDPRFYTTAEAMRDLDEVRAAMGYDKINLYGISYGAAADQVYMRMFPEHVRAVVIDHGTALDLPLTIARPRSVQSALDQVFTYCEQDEKCHAAYPDIRGDWQAILDRLSKGPVVTRFTVPGETKPYQVSKDELIASALNLLYNSGTYTTIPNSVHTLATTVDWTPLVEKSYNTQQSTGEQANGILLMAYMVECFEPWWGHDVAEIDRLNQGSFYREVEVKGAQSMQKICEALPKPDPSLIYPPGKPVPLSALMLNSLLDPQNPPSNMDLAL
jgi:pimeloyl-ACP methyl ester carboxylesterase